MGQETELKFIGPEDALSRLRDSPVLLSLAARRRATTRELKAVYFDTGDFALRDAGVVLRVRDEGQGFVQTVKTIDGPDAATRTEVKSQVAALMPDIDAVDDKRLRRVIEKAARGRALGPVFAVEMQRTTVVLVPKRGTEIEAAFDAGRITTVNGVQAEVPVCEFELELLSGDSKDLVTCARELTAGLPLTLCLQSKAARGYALAGGAVAAPVKSAMLVLPPEVTTSDAFGRVIAHCLHHLLGNWESVAVARDPEGIHQMRVAIRRLRCAFALFGGPFRAALRSLESETHWLAGVLGFARDLDVFDDEVLRPAAEAHGEDARLEALASIIRLRRQDAWDNVIAALESERFRRLMLDIAAATLSKPWLENSTKATMRPAAVLARKRIARRTAQALKHGKNIESLDVKARHKLRIRLKKLRYALDFFASLFSKREVNHYQQRLSALQDVLGHMNDAAVARALVEELLAGSHNDGAAVGYACGVIAGWHLGHGGEYRKALVRQWRRFVKLKPLWK
jgi:inorganic triphosphatase YgiF